jgi:hypothetical protein
MRTNKLNLKRKIKEMHRVIAMKCLDCDNCQPKEVLQCDISGCPLWGKRPKTLRGLYTFIKVLKENNLGFYEADK